MKYYIIAGEASGDMHAANLVAAIKEKEPNAQFRGWGGDLMENEGVVLVKHYKELAYMGFWEVFSHLPAILQNITFCKKDMDIFQPDAVIFVDYPGFNLQIAPYAKKKGYRTIHYISPQVWAWKKGRVKKIKQYIDDMMVILPFEQDFYAHYGYQVHYVGHPTLDVMAKFDPEGNEVKEFRQKYKLDARPIVALLPGSRRQEIKAMLPQMVKMIERFPQYQFLISKVKWQPEALYRSIAEKTLLIEGDTYSLLKNSRAAIVTSGTASLETALLNIPQVVGYRGNWISYFIALLLVKGINYISLANLILNKQIFSELIQVDLNPDRLEKELDILLHNETKREEMQQDYAQLRQILGNGGASRMAAKIVLENCNIQQK